MTVHVLLDLELKTDDLAASYEGVRTTLAQTRARDGALSIDAWVDEKDPARITVVETWDSPDALASYRSWRAGDGIPHALIAVLAAPPVSRTFTPLDAGR